MKAHKKFGMALGGGALALALLGGAVTAQAATVIRADGDENRAIGIDGLIVGGNIYDVTFVFQEGAGPGGLYPPFDFSEPNNASEAVEAVVTALNGAGGAPITGVGQGSDEFHVGYDFEFDGIFNRVSTAFGEVEVTENPTNAVWSSSGFSSPSPRANITESYADFEFVAPVPVPAAVWLFGSALLALVGSARRKKIL